MGSHVHRMTNSRFWKEEEEKEEDKMKRLGGRLVD